MLFLLISMMLICILVKLSIITVLCILLEKKTLSVEGLPFGWVRAPRVFSSITQPILFLCQCEGFHIFILLIYFGSNSF